MSRKPLGLPCCWGAINRKLLNRETMHALFKVLLRIARIRWQRVLEDSRLLRSLLNKVILVVTDGLTKELCIGAYLFARAVLKMGRKSG